MELLASMRVTKRNKALCEVLTSIFLYSQHNLMVASSYEKCWVQLQLQEVVSKYFACWIRVCSQSKTKRLLFACCTKLMTIFGRIKSSLTGWQGWRITVRIEESTSAPFSAKMWTLPPPLTGSCLCRASAYIVGNGMYSWWLVLHST